MAGYKSLQIADALQRVSQELKPQVRTGTLENSVYGVNTNTPNATQQAERDIAEANQYYQSLYSKTGSDYAQDAGVALAKGIVGVPQAAAGLVDLVDAGGQALANIGSDREVQGGRFTKALDDVGVRFGETQDIMKGWYSDATQKQFEQLGALPGTSMDKSLGENLSSIGQTAGFVLDNPSMALNTIVESVPSILAGGVIGRGAAALGGKVAAGAIGEGTIMAGQAQANMDRNAEGYTTGAQSLGALAIGILGGAVGQVGGKLANRHGAADINSVAAGQAAQGASQGFRSLAVGTATEAAEEAAQSSLENVISNVSSGKDALAGLNQDLVLGTLAGAGMGAGVNARSAVSSAALNAVTNAATRQIEKIQQRRAEQQPETTDTPTADFTNPQSPSYNPSAAIIREGKKITSDATPETLNEVSQNINQVVSDAETHLDSLVSVRDQLADIDTLRTNVANGEAAIEAYKDSNPEYVEQITPIVEGLRDQLTTLEQYVGKEDALNDSIDHSTKLVNEARDMQSRFAPALNEAMGTGPIDQQIFGAPTTFSKAQIDQAIADPSVPETSKVALRALSEAVVAQNAVKDIDAVNQQVVGKQFDPNYRSTPQYLEQFAKAVRDNSTPAQANLMREIGAFEQSHVPKTELVGQGLEMAKTQGMRSQIIRNQDGSWAFNEGEFLKGDAAKANGAITIHPTPKGIAAMEKTHQYMQAESNAITATRNAMEAMLQVQTPTQTQQAPVEAPTANVDPMQDALDNFNQEARENYDWNPSGRVEDPRTATSRPEPNRAGSTEAPIPTEVRPSTGGKSGTDTTQVSTKPKPTSPPESAPSLKDTTITFDENGVGSVTPVKPERVASRSESGDVATEAQASTQEANQVTQEESTEEVVTPEVNKEAEPQDINTAEKADKNPERTAERKLPINKRNLIVDGFNKRDTVLNRNDNFMSRFMNRDNNAQVVEHVTGETLTTKQKQAVKDFTKFANYFSPRLDGLIRERKGVTAKGNDYADFRHQDYNQFLLEDGSLPENVKTAVSAAMYTWLAENGSKTLNTEKEVAALLMMDNVEALPADVFSALTGIGQHRSIITGSLGQKALEALGLKAVSDVDPARKQKLEQALGTLAAVALTQNGYLEHTSISNAEYESYQYAVSYENPEASNNVKNLTDGKTVNFLVPKDNDKVNQVIKSAAETKGIVHSMFGVQRDMKLPSLEVVTTTPDSFNRMGSELPSYTKEMLEAAQKNGYKMSAPAMAFMDNVAHEDLRELFGYVKPNADGKSFDGMHKKFWDSQLASNEAVERAIAIIREQRANLGDDSKEFFFELTSWTNTRSGYDAAFNLQANKMHRAVAGMSAHVTEVGIEPVMRNGETTKFGEFLMAVAMTAEEIDIGLSTVDKVSAETYLNAFQEYLQRDNVQKGVESMASILEGQGGKEDMANVKALVNEFGMGAMSVRGIQGLAQMYIAERDGARTFTSDLGFESDGVTNGPVITNVALGTADANTLEAGGVFTDKAKTNVPTNKEQGAKDIYEQLGEVMQKMWADYKKNIKGGATRSANALDFIYDAFGKRKGAKPIVTTSNYGAGLASIKRANAREVVNSFYKKLEKAGNQADMNTAQNLINAVNEVIQYSNFKQKLNVPKAVASGEILEFMLTAEQEAALFFAAELQHGIAIEDTLNSAMAEFNSVRDRLTNQAVNGFKVYEQIRNQAIEAALADTDGVLVDSKGNRQEGLTSDQMKKVLKSIERYMPSVVSGMGNMSTNKKKSSIPLMKQDTVWDGSKMSEQQFNFKGSWDKKGDGNFTVRSAIKRDTVSDPGVSGLALIIQSIDAMIAHTTIGNIPTQNYHDANASAVGQGKAMARIQNEAFVDGLIHTHVNREFSRAYMAPLTALLDGTYKPTAQELTALFTKGDKNTFTSVAREITSAYNRDIKKLHDMQTWENVNQYGTQGGHFEMNDAKRSEIVKEVDKLKAELKKDLETAEKIDKHIAALTKPAVEDKSTTQGLLDSNPTTKAADLVPVLQAELKEYKGNNAKFFDAMLDLISKRMPASLEINYFEEAGAPENVNGLDTAIENKNPAWFTTGKDGNPQINILKTDKPVTAYVLVHELVHAITVDSIAQVRNEPTAHAKAAESLSKLDALYNDIKAKVEADPNATDLMKYATQNLEEFVATGFSYPEFVQYLDKQLAPKAARGKNRIVTALRSFVDNIMGLLESFTGRKYSAKDATALEALILDTTEFLGRTDAQTTGTQTSIFGVPEQARNNVAGYTSKQVFDALNSNIDPQFKLHLDSMMTQVSDTIYAGLDQSLIDNPDGTWSPEKAWEEFVDSGNAYTSETATTAGFRMTEQESFAVESLYAALSHGLKDKAMTQVYAEMDKAFKGAAKKLKPQDFHNGDWDTADRYEKQDAQDMHDFIFKYGRNNPEPLARFVSMAIGSQQFNSLLGFTAKDGTQAPTDAFGKLVEGTNDALNFVTGLMTNSSSSQLVNNRLGLLAKELARIDTKNREFAVGKLEQQLEKLADYTDGVSQKVRDQVEKLANQDFIANSRFTAVRLAGNATALSARGDLWTTLDVLKDAISHENPNQRLGFVGELLNEAANNDSTKNGVERMLRLTKLNNQMKENIRDTTTKNVMSTFEENGTYLDKDTKASLTTMLRSDVQALTDTYSVKEISKMYSDQKYLTQEIKSLESQVGDQVMINRAKQLAKYIVTGKSSKGLAKNAQLIVSGFTSGQVVDSTDPRVDLIDRIASMYAIQYTPSADKKRINDVMKRELKNKVNGIDTAIKFHKELAKVAKDTLFVDNATSVTKGYMPEVTNPNREIRIANNEAEAQLLKDQYFKEVKVIGKDRIDPNKGDARLFLTEEANNQRILSGAVEIVSTNRKGTSVEFPGTSFNKAVQDIKASLPNSPNYNPMMDKDIYMVPNYNTQNEIIGFSYEMSGQNRDVLLERNNDFAELLGAYASTNFNKTTVPTQNNLVVDAALQDYKENFSKNPRAYVQVGPNSNDPGLREIWAMLPQATRDHITKTWGKDGMQVRNDTLLMMFGYRKYSVNQAFDKMEEAKSTFEKLYTNIMTELFGNNAKVTGVRAERGWQEAVRLMKDIVVIRNVKTMVANMMSNSFLLMAHGVSPSDLIKDTMLSVRAGMQYRKDTALLMAARQKQRAGVGDFNQLEQEALKLEDALSRNPLNEFIEEGMMPTIVEDVDPDTDHYSYKSKLQTKVDELTENVPASVKTAAKWAMVSPDTPLYKFLNNATQFSDFSAKYVMYKYYTEKAKEKMSHEDAIQTASDNFINYDVPTGKGLQYLNDMGIVMFTKYNIRIQKALFQLLKKRPAAAMAQAMFINSFTNLEAGIDPLIWFNMGVPLRAGALGLPSALDEPLPIKMMAGMF